MLSQIYTSRKSTDARVRIANWRLDRIEVDVDTNAPAIVKLNSLYYPGWEAEVDGVSKPVLAVDLIFRGVEVPPGARSVVFTFRPFSWRNMSNAFADVFNLAETK